MIHIKFQQRGFTIIELMIATSVFAVVLLLCSYGLLEIGRTYYKGATITRTQETARIVIDEVAEAIQFNGGEVVANTAAGWHCIGTKRYSFVLNRQLTETNHALVSDAPPASCTTGTGAQNINGGLLSGSRELMNVRTRLSRFDIVPLAGADGLYRITVRVVSGDDDVLEDRNGSGTITAADNPIECKNERTGSQFCAASELTTVVQKRV
ncbi:MAG TPA: type II secretion system protein [Candidatus Limnocylindria bacterium]|nr:type II secretion system protein [Candidatus Limnocylindria bacterium]